jgi:hypothetical protein
MIWILDI